MKILIFILIIGFSTELSAQKLKSENHNKSNSTERLIAAGNKITNSLPTCNICSGTGKVTCSNCSDWSSEYKRKRACDYCKDTRKVNCKVCGGSGKFIQRELILSQEDLDVYIAKNSPMSASSQYPMRPVQDRTKFIEIIEDNSDKIKEQENAKKLLIENAKKKESQLLVTNQNIKELKDFFISDSFNISADPSTFNLIKIIKLGSNNVINLSTYKIKKGFIIDNDNGSVYNKYGNLVYKGNAIYNILQFVKDNGEMKSYLFFNFYDKSESSYRNILGDYRGETILNQLENDKIKLYLVSASNELEEFDVSKYRNNRILVTRFYSATTRDLSDIQYEYQIIDLETETKSKIIQEQNLKKNINKIQKKISSMADAFKSALN